MGLVRPAQAWQRRQHAQTLITLDFLRREHQQHGKPLRQIAEETGIGRHIISQIATELGYQLSPGQRRIIIDEQWLRHQYLIKRRSFPDIAAECGTSEMTVTRCARQYRIPARPPGITSHPQMITKLAPTLHRDIRRAVEGGLHGWQRLHRFRQIIAFPTIQAAANALAISQATLVRQLQRLETDIGTTLYHRATIAQQLRPTRRGAALLHALDHPDAQQHLTATTKRGTKANDQLPRKQAPPEVINYHGSRREKPQK